MQNNSLAFSIGGFVFLGLLGLVASLVFLGQPIAHANPYTATFIGAASTTVSVAVTTSTVVLATTTNALGNGTSYTRVYSTICNPNANPVYISLNNGIPASATSATYVIAAAAGYNTCFETTDRNMYSGSITASSTNQTSTTIFASQYVQ